MGPLKNHKIYLGWRVERNLGSSNNELTIIGLVMIYYYYLIHELINQLSGCGLSVWSQQVHPYGVKFVSKFNFHQSVNDL